jgi:quinohemoprotein ethanol dehydrogenase
VVVPGQLNGRFSAYSATKGKELWHFDAQNAVLGAPISYRVDGEQYVTVVVGMGTSAATFQPLLGGLTFDYRTQKRRVLTFKLDGRSSLPAKSRTVAVRAVLDPAYRPDAALAQRGAMTYGRSCGNCHGVGTVAAGAAPDLRASMAVLDQAIFGQIVHDGALVSAGMPRFDNLTDQDLRAVRQYIRANAASLRSGAAANIDTAH